ncbi:MAG: BamA/TamA family outer membrane protein [Gemmatimonadaceae bacterium]|nr:BamA/TamA family outer membrane protein [Gemmatimonadaceae bacterium]
MPERFPDQRHLSLSCPVTASPIVALLGAVCLLVGISAGTLPAQDDELERPEVLKLVFEGVDKANKGELQRSIATEESHCKNLLAKPFCLFTKWKIFYDRHYLEETEFRRDVLRIRVFYWKRGYREAEVDTVVQRGDKGVRITFKIDEGRPTRVSSIVVRRAGDVLTNREVGNLMRIRAGEPLDLFALDSSKVLLRDRLFERGYADGDVIVDTVVVDDSLKTAAIQMTVLPKWRTTVGKITIKGDSNISERTIRNSLVLKEGRVYRRSDLLQSQRNLYESNLFRQATIVIPPKGDSTKEIEVSVREAPLREMRTSGGFNTVDFIQLEQRFTRYNFLGGARRLDLRGVVGNILAPQLNGALIFKNVTRSLTPSEEDVFLRPTWSASADFTQPWFRDPRNSIGLSIFGHRRSAPDIFIDRGYGLSATFTRLMAYRAPASLNYRFEVTKVEAGDVYYCQNFGVCELNTIGALRRSQHLSPLSLSVFTDRTNDLFYPTSGYILRGDAEHASAFTLSDFRYNRVFGEANKYWAVGKRGAIATRLRSGFVRALESTSLAVGEADDPRGSILHPRKRFYAGGSQSVRGFGENQLGPRVLTVDPSRLKDDDLEGPECTDATIIDGSCNPNAADLPSSEFQPRPTGGTSLLEGSVEYRFPLWDKIGGAVFVDAAVVGEGSTTLVKGTGAITPGFGFRYYSSAGAIRVDLGFRPKLTEDLPVVTQIIREDGEIEIRALDARRRYSPVDATGGFLSEVTNRLALHLSIGQAF